MTQDSTKWEACTQTPVLTCLVTSNGLPATVSYSASLSAGRRKSAMTRQIAPLKRSTAGGTER
jgi:hypothetical protein